MHTDGAFGPEGTGAGIVLKSPEGEEYTFALHFSIPVTNNEAEYEALLSGMRVAKYFEVKELSVYVDSHLVANQFSGIFEAHDESMQKYLNLVQELAVDFDLFQITQVSRTLNKKADVLSKLAALTFSHFKKEIWVEEVKVKSIETDGVSAAVEEEEQSWMTPIVEFLNKGTLPIGSIEARKIKMKAPMYLLDKGILYRKSFLGPHLRCLNPTQAKLIIREVHEGMCALHSRHKTVASKIMRLGYYWPSMYRDAAKVIRKCQSCQLHTPVSKALRQPMIPVASPWPFCKWAIDIVGPFPVGPGGVKFLLLVSRTKHKANIDISRTPPGERSEAVIPAEINVPTMRIASFDESSNSEELRENLNLVEERMEMAAIKEAINKQRITSYYNKSVQPLSFQLDDLMWQKNDASRSEDMGKLGPKWEGPYKVIGVHDIGAYRLASLDGKTIKCTWHA
ncbi:uncharacterized protein [Rutidosis leptorrhynchoides]|uniref:uncharacterized protein n=1 Tax=Rutidosis leptorrhynchoides TaxID=125765 RepID=UPI003A9A5566